MPMLMPALLVAWRDVIRVCERMPHGASRERCFELEGRMREAYHLLADIAPADRTEVQTTAVRALLDESQILTAGGREPGEQTTVGPSDRREVERPQQAPTDPGH